VFSFKDKEAALIIILQSSNPSILQSFNPSILQSFNPSILQSFNPIVNAGALKNRFDSNTQSPFIARINI